MMTKQEAKERLLEYVKSGDEIYTVLRHVSSSGMQRRIDCYVIKNNRIHYLSGYMEGLGIAKRKKDKDGLVVNGCGMDMGFALVYDLSQVLFGKQELKHSWL